MTEPTDAADAAGPYGTAATTYHQSGWTPLPLPAGAKKHPPKGWTGNGAPRPSGADIYAWTEDHADGNIALRMPADVIGVDVDSYDDKPGGAVIADLERRLGDLPPTWRSTSRDDGTSGIRLYRVPPGLAWPGILGPGIETIQDRHRYAVAWPSIHPNGGTYRWITPEGNPAAHVIPTPDDLPHLPDAWIAHFTGGEMAGDHARADLPDNDATAWLTTGATTEPCRHIQRALTDGLAGLTAATSRHDHTLALTNRLVWLHGEGHHGTTNALAQARAAFLAATSGDREGGEAEAEWDRMVLGAVRMAAAANPTPETTDPCDNPFEGLIRKDDNPWTTTTTTATPSSTVPNSLDQSPTTTPDAAPATDGAISTEAKSSETDEASDEERTTWWPKTLDGILDGTIEEETPEHLTRSDGNALLYAGRINGIIGPSESGKTWVGLTAITQAITAGQRVTILDFEDTDRGMIGRLKTLGLTDQQIRAQVAYIGPDEPLATAQESDLHEHLDTWQPAIVLLDGFNAAMTLHDLDLLSNRDVTFFFQRVLKYLKSNGATVIYVDHTPKDKNNESAGGIGAQAKRAMTDGSTLRASITKEFGKGQDGNIRLFVDKDRHGFVRSHAEPFKVGERSLHWVADAVLTSTGESNISIELRGPQTVAEGREKFRPTVYMERVSNWLHDNSGAGRNEILREVEGKAEYIKTALSVLVEEGWVTVTDGGNRKRSHELSVPYSEAAEIAGASPKNEWGPGGVPVGSRTPLQQVGSLGSRRGDVVPTDQDPTAGDSNNQEEQVGSGTSQRRPGRRTPVAGGRLEYDHDTKLTYDAHTGEVTGP